MVDKKKTVAVTRHGPSNIVYGYTSLYLTRRMKAWQNAASPETLLRVVENPVLSLIIIPLRLLSNSFSFAWLIIAQTMEKSKAYS